MTDDPFDPQARFFIDLRQKTQKTAVAVIAVLAFVVFVGVPSVSLNPNQRISSDYWNPLVGVREVARGEFGQRGCPPILFMPLKACTDLEPFRNPVTVFFFGEEFFDEQAGTTESDLQ